jgi:regulator of sigma E protease
VDLEWLLNVLISGAAFLVILVVVIMAHELGHFGTAKLCGIKVEEFGIGFPPRALSFKRGETTYSLNWIPLGGFTKLAGEEDPNVPRSLASKSKGVRLLVLAAGSMMNVILPIILFTVIYMVPHDVAMEPVLVKDVAAGSPAAVAGIRAGDTILSLDGKTLRNRADLSSYAYLSLGKEVTLLVEHSDATTETVSLVPRWQYPAEEGPIGVEFDVDAILLNRTVVEESYPFWKAVPLAITQCIDTLILYKNSIVLMIAGVFGFSESVWGLVGIAYMTGEVARAGFVSLLEFTAFISIMLAVVNLFPLPALDGGRVAFVLLEVFRGGRVVSPEIEGKIHLVGFVLLFSVMIFFVVYDLMRIINGVTPI